MIIMKFGGTSVGTAESIDNALKIVQDRLHLDPVLVVSAHAGVTNALVELGQAAPSGRADVSLVIDRHLRLLEELGLPLDLLDAQHAAQISIASKVRRDTAWLNQGIQGRQTRNKSQVQAAALRRQELKETINRNQAPSDTASFAFNATDRKTKKLITLKGVSKPIEQKSIFPNHRAHPERDGFALIRQTFEGHQRNQQLVPHPSDIDDDRRRRFFNQDALDSGNHESSRAISANRRGRRRPRRISRPAKRPA